jgi:DUF4097 and DUF4098 domain-containing protein YvlB
MKNYMKIALLSLSFLAPAISLAEDIDQILDVESDGRINIDVMDGRVTIEGWDKPQVRIVGKAPINEHNFTFKTSGSNTKIEHTGEHGFWNSHRGRGSADFTVYAPRNSRFRVESKSAEFMLKNINGQVRANSMSGDIMLQGGRGSIDLQSVSGNVIVNGASGRLNLASISGNIEADGSAEEFEAQTVSGNINARIGKSNSIDLASVSGDIDLNVFLAEDARLDADTVSGDIEIMFESETINASFDIDTGPGGDVRNRLSDHKPKKEFSFSGSMRFKLGNGDSSVNLETMSGTIEIDR